MIYNDPPQGLYATADEILSAYDPATYITVPTVIGIGAREIGGFPVSGFPLSKSGAYQKAIALLATVMEELATDKRIIATGGYFLRTSIFRYDEIASTYTPGGLAGFPSYIAYLMSRGMTLVEIFRAISSGNLPPAPIPHGPWPESYPAYLDAANALLSGVQLIMRSSTEADSASSKQLVDDGLKMVREADEST